MTEKLFSFRWDIDHRACMTDGVPKIKSLCRDLGVTNTFFINMGRSTNLREWLGKGLSGSRAKFKDKEAINLVQKIGWSRFITETILSRPVGMSFIGELQQLQADGHELGLHGGSDHVIWSRRFYELTEGELEGDLAATYGFYTKCFGKPAGFTSPGFKSDDRVMRVLEKFKFQYNGDAIGGPIRKATSHGKELSHWTIPVTICGPRTIPFLEWHGARSTTAEYILSDLNHYFESDQPVILYGHPCYEGVNIELLRAIFERVLEKGYQFVNHETISDLLNNKKIVTN